MEESKEISALFQLIDDPDEEVFDAISKKIVDFGKPIIPNLEHLWETNPSGLPTLELRIDELARLLLYYAEGKLPESEALYREALELKRKRVGNDGAVCER